MVGNPKYHYVVYDENNEKFRVFNFANDAMNFIRIRPEFTINKEIRKDWVDIWSLEPCLF